MSKKEQRRQITKSVIYNMLNNKGYDASKDLKEVFSLSREIRSEDAYANAEI